MVAFELLEPTSLSETCSLLAKHKGKAKIIAGGQTLLVLLRHRLISQQYIINIKGLSDLDYITEAEDGLAIGALTTHRAIETSAVIRSSYPMLSEMERSLASVQVRNWGTIGGNLSHADPAGDPAAPLIALRAKVTATSTRGSREIPLEDFFVDYFETALESDEILTEIKLPRLASSTGGAYSKESVRHGDAALAGVAAVVSLNGNLEVKDARIVLSGVGSTPLVAKEAQKAMVGKTVKHDLLEEIATIAAGEAKPTTDTQGSVELRRQLVKVLTKQVVSQAISRAQAT